MDKDNSKSNSKIAEKLRTEAPAELAPSPILSAEKIKNNTLPLIILAAIACISIIANIYFISSLIYKNSKIAQLELDIEKKTEDIHNLRVRLNSVEE